MCHITALTNDGVWTWFNDPRAIVVGDHLYAGWINRGGDVEIARVDLAHGVQEILAIERAFERDDHDNPALIANPDGTIGVYYARHGGGAVRTAAVSGGAEKLRFINPPRDIPTSGDDVSGPRGWSYANPIRLQDENGKLYLFSRGPNFNPVVRIFDGVRWSAARNVIFNLGERPYVKYASNGTDTIAFAYTDAHPNREPGNNIYYAELRGDALWRADRTKIKDLCEAPLSMSESEKVFDRTANPKLMGDNAWIWDVALDPQTGRPTIAFATFPSLSSHQYHVARWTGSEWEDQILLESAGGAITGSTSVEPHYSGGMALDSVDPNILYLARHAGQWSIEQWKREDTDVSWSHRRTIARSRAREEKLFRPYVPRHRPGHIEMVVWLAGQYGYWNFSRGIGYQTGVHLWTEQIA